MWIIIADPFTDVADTSMYIPYYNNGQQKSIAAKNNRNVPLITDDFLSLATKKRVLKAI